MDKETDLKVNSIQNKTMSLNSNEALINDVIKLNLKKKVVSKYVEVTTKIIYTFEDGSKKESNETESHTYLN